MPVIRVTDWFHPHETFNIIDNSQYLVNNANTGPALRQVFVSSKGPDNKIIRYRDHDVFLATYGRPDMRTYGQSYYQALNWLAEGGVVDAMRLTAADAIYSNIVISAKIAPTTAQKTVLEMVQKTNADGELLYYDADGNETTLATDPDTLIDNTPIMVEGTNMVPVYYDDAGNETTVDTGNPVMVTTANVTIVGNKISNLTDTTMVQSVMDAIRQTSTPEVQVFPLFVVNVTGRGKYGDFFRIRMTPNKVKDREYNFRNYSFQLLTSEEGIQEYGNTFTVSLHPEARDVYSLKSMYITDVINVNLSPINITTYDDYIYEAEEFMVPILNDAYKEEIANGDIPAFTPASVDLINFFERSAGSTLNVVYKNITVTDDSLNLTNVDGIGLQSGSDGTFDVSNPNRWEAINARLEDAFNGNIDKYMLDYKQFDSKVILDANFPIAVKYAMWHLQNALMATSLDLDMNFCPTVLDVKQTRLNELNLDEFGVTIHSQHMKVTDTYNGRTIEVTTPWILSIMYPRNWIAFGDNIPVAGVNANITDLVREGSVVPAYSEQDKSDLFEMQVNYIEYTYGRYELATEVTSQFVRSHLSSKGNVNVLFDILRDCMTVAPSIRYMLKETQEHYDKINEVVENAVGKYRDNKCRSLRVTVGPSNLGDDHIDIVIEIAFNTRVLIQHYTIVVNR